MKKLFAIVATAVLPLIASAAAHAAPNPTIAGLRLGMTMAEATTAVAARTEKVDGKDIRGKLLEPQVSDVVYSLGSGRKVTLPNSRFTSNQTVLWGTDRDLTLSLIYTRDAADQRVMALRRVIFWPGLQERPSLQAVADQLLQQYGAPTFGGQRRPNVEIAPFRGLGHFIWLYDAQGNVLPSSHRFEGQHQACGSHRALSLNVGRSTDVRTTCGRRALIVSVSVDTQTGPALVSTIISSLTDFETMVREHERLQTRIEQDMPRATSEERSENANNRPSL